MSPFYRIIIAATSVFMLVGLMPSVICDDWHWLERSGSLLVLIGAYVTLLDLRGEIEHSFKFSRRSELNAYEERLKGIQQHARGIIYRQMQIGNVERELDASIENLTKQEINQLIKYRCLEVVIVALGTLVWGYGGVLNNIIR